MATTYGESVLVLHCGRISPANAADSVSLKRSSNDRAFGPFCNRYGFRGYPVVRECQLVFVWSD